MFLSFYRPRVMQKNPDESVLLLSCSSDFVIFIFRLSQGPCRAEKNLPPLHTTVSCVVSGLSCMLEKGHFKHGRTTH